MKRENSNKEIKKVGSISDHQWGVVENRGGWHKQSSQAVTSTNKSQSVNVVGGIGMTARRNRDDGRVLGGNGICYTLKSHIDKDHPLVLKKI